MTKINMIKKYIFNKQPKLNGAFTADPDSHKLDGAYIVK
jgi:hypothetical protein